MKNIHFQNYFPSIFFSYVHSFLIPMWKERKVVEKLYLKRTIKLFTFNFWKLVYCRNYFGLLLGVPQKVEWPKAEFRKAKFPKGRMVQKAECSKGRILSVIGECYLKHAFRYHQIMQTFRKNAKNIVYYSSLS